MPEQVKKYLVPLIYFALAVSVLLVFWQVRNFDFVNYDDNDYVYENPHILNGLSYGSVICAFTTPHVGNWLPLTWLSFMLDCHLFGPNPGWMHLVNLLLHIANTLLLFAILKKMTASLWPCAFVAAAFALHPMHVESVAWVTERKDVLSTFFLMLTLAAYVRYARRHSLFYYLLTILLFALSLLAKPMFVTLPFVLLLLDYWPLNRLNSKLVRRSDSEGGFSILNSFVEKIPFFALAAVSSAVTFIVQKGIGSVADINTLSLQSRVANAFLSYTRYIGKMFWPQNLSVLYPFDIDRFSFWQIAMCAMLLLGISVFAVRFGRKKRYLLVGWFWFVVTLIPVIGLVQSGVQSLADRYTYIPYVGLFIMVAWGLPELLSNWPYRKFALGISAVIALTTLGICARLQAGFWNNSIALFSHAIKVTQNNYLTYYNLGIACGKLGRYQDEIESYKQAIKIKPDYARAHCNLGVAYGELGRYQDAIESCKQAVIIKPDLAEAHYNLGVIYGKLGRYQDAVESYKQAIRIEPDYADAHSNLGLIYRELGRYQDAVESCKQAIRIKPDDANAHYNLGAAYGELGRYQDAAESLKQAVRIKPDDADAHYNLGVAYGELGRYQDAVESFKQAILIKPDFAVAHYNLGITYLQVGDKSSALEQYKILKTLDTEQANKLFNSIYK